MTPLVWSWLLVTLGALGMWLAGRRMAVGWAVAIVNETLWIVYAIQTRQWGFIAGALLYIAVFTRNWLRWSREPSNINPGRAASRHYSVRQKD